MLKPFYNKKKNINDRLVPAVSVADAGKFLGVTEDGKIAPVEGGGGSQYPVVYVNATSSTEWTLVYDFDILKSAINNFQPVWIIINKFIEASGNSHPQIMMIADLAWFTTRSDHNGQIELRGCYFNRAAGGHTIVTPVSVQDVYIRIYGDGLYPQYTSTTVNIAS